MQAGGAISDVYNQGRRQLHTAMPFCNAISALANLVLHQSVAIPTRVMMPHWSSFDAFAKASVNESNDPEPVDISLTHLIIFTSIYFMTYRHYFLEILCFQICDNAKLYTPE
jgi:hypothetical protein